MTREEAIKIIEKAKKKGNGIAITGERGITTFTTAVKNEYLHTVIENINKLYKNNLERKDGLYRIVAIEDAKEYVEEERDKKIKELINLVGGKNEKGKEMDRRESTVS